MSGKEGPVNDASGMNWAPQDSIIVALVGVIIENSKFTNFIFNNRLLGARGLSPSASSSPNALAHYLHQKSAIRLLLVPGLKPNECFLRRGSLGRMCMIRNSTKELLLPFANPKQKFRSKRRLFDTPSLVELNSPELDHYFDIEEQSKEEVRETMTETMEQYMSKTRENYGSSVTRLAINQDTPFELKGKFLKELRDNTFSGSEHEDANEHIEKVLEIVDLFHIPKVTQDQIMLRAFPISLIGAASRWLRNQPSGSITTWKGPYYTKDFPQKEEGKTFDELILLSSCTYQSRDDNIELALRAWIFLQMNHWDTLVSWSKTELEESLTKFMAESAKRHEENSNIIKEIRASTDAAIRNQVASIKTLEIQIEPMSNILEVQDVKILDAYDHTLPQKEKDPGSFTLPCFIHNICCGFNKALVDLGASVSVMPFSTYTNHGLGNLSHTRLTVELADQTIKQPRGIAENVLVKDRSFSIISGFTIINDDDMTKDVVLSIRFCKKYASCQRIMKKFALGDNCK
ncbi:retrovirus-related pol polyprotein from transposon TNT 1-94 [Tanacetum coccineum]